MTRIDSTSPGGRVRTGRSLGFAGEGSVASSLLRIRPLSVIGLVLFCLSLWARLPGINAPYDFFDSGLVLTNAHLILLGSLPYRDFYTNYGPGTFLLAAGLWKVLGIGNLALALRLLALASHVAISLVSGRLAGRVKGGRFSWLACGLVSLWMAPLGLSPFAWNIGLGLALAFIELLLGAIDSPGRLRFFVAGLTLGALGCIRHDLMVYLTLPLGCLWALPRRVYRWLDVPVPPRRQLGWLAVGAAAVLVPVWIPLLVAAGFHRVIDDLFLSQVRYVMPGRVLPLPSLLARDGLGQWVVWRSRFEGAVALTFAGPILAALFLAARWPLRVAGKEMTIASLGCLAVAVLPQMTGRTDWIHALFTVAPALTLLCAMLETFVRRPRPPWWPKTPLAVAIVAVVAFSNWPIVWPPSLHWPRYIRLPTYNLESPRIGFSEPDASIGGARQAVLDFIAQHTSPGDAIYVGTQRHDRVHANETDLYFLANRRAGTRYTQFDPNVVTREEVQKEMIASLERNKVRVLVLSNRADWYENQPGVLPGSTLLDEYIAKHFAVAARYPPYIVYARPG